VFEVLGKPTEVKDCFYSQFGSTPEIRQKCAKEYWYIAFLQEWVYVIAMVMERLLRNGIVCRNEDYCGPELFWLLAEQTSAWSGLAMSGLLC